MGVAEIVKELFKIQKSLQCFQEDYRIPEGIANVVYLRIFEKIKKIKKEQKEKGYLKYLCGALERNKSIELMREWKEITGIKVPKEIINALMKDEDFDNCLVLFKKKGGINYSEYKEEIQKAYQRMINQGKIERVRKLSEITEVLPKDDDVQKIYKILDEKILDENKNLNGLIHAIIFYKVKPELNKEELKKLEEAFKNYKKWDEIGFTNYVDFILLCGIQLENEELQNVFRELIKRRDIKRAVKLKELEGKGPSIETIQEVFKFYLERVEVDKGIWDNMKHFREDMEELGVKIKNDWFSEIYKEKWMGANGEWAVVKAVELTGIKATIYGQEKLEEIYKDCLKKGAFLTLEHLCRATGINPDKKIIKTTIQTLLKEGKIEESADLYRTSKKSA